MRILLSGAGVVAASLLFFVTACDADGLARKPRASGLLMSVVTTAAAAKPADADEALAGSPERGQKVYGICSDCHELTFSRTGPQHCGLFGRRAGSLPGYEFSAAMAGANIVWDERNLNRFLADPQAMVPGTTMGQVRVANAQQRADVIAYLKQVNQSPVCAR